MQVEEMRDFFSQKKNLWKNKCNTTGKASWRKRILYQVDQTFLQKNENSPRISQEHVRTLISEAVAEVQKNFYKIYFFE